MRNSIQKQLLNIEKVLWSDKEKVAMIVDGAYVFMEARKHFGRNVNYAALLRRAIEDGQLLDKAIIFTFENPKAEKFHDVLKNLGYDVQTKPTKVFANGKTKCNFDGEIITEMFKLAEDGVHRIVLVAGDSDFESPICYLKGKGNKIRVIGIKGTVASELKSIAPVRYIDESMLMCSNSE